MKTSAVRKKLDKHVWTAVAVYLISGMAWILYSDLLVETFFTPEQVTQIQTYKGSFFVVLTAGILLTVLKRKNHAIRDLFFRMRHNMKSFRDTFEQTAVGMAHISTDGEWLRVNSKLCDILGYRRQELLSIPILEVVHPEDREEGRRKDQKIIDGDWDSYVTQKRYLTKSGEVISTRLTKSAIKDTDGNTKYLSGVVEDISKQKEVENQLKISLQEKKRLLSELHHRVKNNLAIISGLLELQTFNTKSNAVKKILKESLMRIKSMALMHESYYKSESISAVQLDEYLEDFIGYVSKSFEEHTAHITIRYNTHSFSLNINQAIPTGLLLNEFLINAYLHAFKNRDEGTITVTLDESQDQITLRVHDNGVGLSEDLSLDDASSLGMTIIRTLTNQLNGDTTIDRSNGTTFETTFKREEKRGSSSNFQVEPVDWLSKT